MLIPDKIIGAVHIVAYKPQQERSSRKPLKRLHEAGAGHMA
jgi:hypothetical protein